MRKTEEGERERERMRKIEKGSESKRERMKKQ